MARKQLTTENQCYGIFYRPGQPVGPAEECIWATDEALEKRTSEGEERILPVPMGCDKPVIVYDGKPMCPLCFHEFLVYQALSKKDVRWKDVFGEDNTTWDRSDWEGTASSHQEELSKSARIYDEPQVDNRMDSIDQLHDKMMAKTMKGEIEGSPG